jgi:hypothetical protein
MVQPSDNSQPRKSLGRPSIDQELEALVVRMARENRSWGYDRIVGALANLGYRISDQTVGNLLKRHGTPPAPERKQTMNGVYPYPQRRPHGDRLFHHRSAELVRIGDLCSPLLHPRRSPHDTWNEHDRKAPGMADAADLTAVSRLTCRRGAMEMLGHKARAIAVAPVRRVCMVVWASWAYDR